MPIHFAARTLFAVDCLQSSIYFACLTPLSLSLSKSFVSLSHNYGGKAFYGSKLNGGQWFPQPFQRRLSYWQWKEQAGSTALRFAETHPNVVAWSYIDWAYPALFGRTLLLRRTVANKH